MSLSIDASLTGGVLALIPSPAVVTGFAGSNSDHFQHEQLFVFAFDEFQHCIQFYNVVLFGKNRC